MASRMLIRALIISVMVSLSYAALALMWGPGKFWQAYILVPPELSDGGYFEIPFFAIHVVLLYSPAIVIIILTISLFAKILGLFVGRND